MSMLDFFVALRYVFGFDCTAVIDSLHCAQSRCCYELWSPSHKLLPSAHEDVALQRPAVRALCVQGGRGGGLPWEGRS